MSLIVSSNGFAMKNGIVKFYNESKGFGLIKEELSENGFGHADVEVIIDIAKDAILVPPTGLDDIVKRTLEEDALIEKAAMEQMRKALLAEKFSDSDIEVIMQIMKESGGRHTPFHNKGINQAGIKRNEASLEKQVQEGKKGLNAVNVKYISD